MKSLFRVLTAALAVFMLVLLIDVNNNTVKVNTAQNNPDINNQDGILNGVTEENGNPGNALNDGNTENTDFSEEKPEEAQPAVYFTGYGVYSLKDLNVRAQPSGVSEVLGVLYAGEYAVYIENAGGGWYKVYYKGRTAYISSKFDYSIVIKTHDKTKADYIIEEGLAVLGTPYEYGAQRLLLYNGGLNPNFTGETFDCSAFVQYIFYQGAKIKLNSDSRSQSTQGKDVAMSELQKGDVIFFTSTSRQYNTGIERIGHVALYLSDNKILHTFGTGGVRIQEFSDFWRGRFIKAKRMF